MYPVDIDQTQCMAIEISWTKCLKEVRVLLGRMGLGRMGPMVLFGLLCFEDIKALSHALLGIL